MNSDKQGKRQLSRRDFLRVTGLAGGMTLLSACARQCTGRPATGRWQWRGEDGRGHD
jgi:hypothetical protein